MSAPAAILSPVNGGMGRRGHGPLIDRVNATRARRAGEAATVEAVAETPPPPDLKHVWVTDEHGRRAGLLLRWEKRGDTWWARVSYAALDAEGWALVEDWLPAERLEQA